jgi:hypothetical protein
MIGAWVLQWHEDVNVGMTGAWVLQWHEDVNVGMTGAWVQWHEDANVLCKTPLSAAQGIDGLLVNNLAQCPCLHH